MKLLPLCIGIVGTVQVVQLPTGQRKFLQPESSWIECDASFPPPAIGSTILEPDLVLVSISCKLWNCPLLKGIGYQYKDDGDYLLFYLSSLEERNEVFDMLGVSDSPFRKITSQ